MKGRPPMHLLVLLSCSYALARLFRNVENEPPAKWQKIAELETVGQLQVTRDTNEDAKGMGPRRV